MKTMFVTGATVNSGLAIARKFASQGYQVALTSRRKEAAEATAAALEKEFGVKVRGYGLNLRDVEEIKAVFAKVKEELGGVDVFVGNSANLGIGQEAISIDQESFDDVFEVNVRGNYFCCQQAAQQMKEKGGGSIVLIGSVHYKAAIWGRSLYAASKGAIATMVRSLAFELAEHGIRVNQVVAGAIRTDRWNGVDDETAAKRRANWPTQHEATGDQIAAGVYFLCTEDACNITGSDLTIDSGVLSCLLTYNGGKH